MALACADGNSVEYDIGTLKSVAKRVLIAGIVSTSATRNHVFFLRLIWWYMYIHVSIKHHKSMIIYEI